jgi:hypothetical protein
VIRLITVGLLACVVALSSEASGSDVDTALMPSAPPLAAARVSKQRDRDRLGWAVPDLARVHTGGFAGLLGIGVGYAAFEDSLNAAVLYGFVPAAIAGETVHSISATFSVRPLDLVMEQFRVIPAYIGAGLLLSIGAGDYFVRVPERYRHIDSRYYEPTALHWTAHTGLELDWVPPGSRVFERHGVYVELTVLGSFLLAYFENSRIVNLTDTVSSGFGYRAAF